MQVLFWLSIGLDRRTPSEHLLTAIVEALYKQGHTVHILQKDTGGDKAEMPQRMVELGVTTTRIKSNPPKRSNLIARYLEDIKYVLNCRKWLKKNRGYDRIFMQSSNVAGIQTRILRHVQKGVPVIFNVQDIFPENAVYSGKMKAGSFMYRCFAAMQRHAYRYASKIITISEDMQDQLIEIGASAEKIEVVYNWSYRDTMYDPEEIDYSCLNGIIDRSKFNVVYAGNIGVMQNVEIVIRAAAQMKDDKDICFHVIGDGVYRKKLENLAAELHADNVAFHDMMGSECAPAIYSAADVNVIPLAENIYRTALPSKTATCLACGKPIIFAIGKKSKFANRLMKHTGCPVIDSDRADELCCELHIIREKGNSCDMENEFKMSFSNLKNRARYVDIIKDTL